MKRIYIYGLFDSAHLNNIRYVGRTWHPGQRADTHLRGGDKRTCKWIAECKNNNLDVRLVILQSVSLEDSSEREAWWISYLSPNLNTNGLKPCRYAPQIDGCEPSYFWKDQTRYFFSMREIQRFFDASHRTVKIALENGSSFWSGRLSMDVKITEYNGK